MNPDTLHKLQVAAFWFIGLQLLVLNIILIVYGLEIAAWLPELLEAINDLGRAL